MHAWAQSTIGTSLIVEYASGFFAEKYLFQSYENANTLTCLIVRVGFCKKATNFFKPIIKISRLI